MKNNILAGLFCEDKRSVFSSIIASMEAIEQEEADIQMRESVLAKLADAGEELAAKFPENELAHQGLATAIGQIADDGVSTESLAGALAKLFSKKKPDASVLPGEDNQSMVENRKALNEFLRLMEKTYLNRSWMSKQTFVTTPISGGEPCRILELDGVPVTDVFANLEEGRKRVLSFRDQWVAILKPLSEKVNAIDEKANREAAAIIGNSHNPSVEDRVKVFAIMSSAGAELDKLPDPVDKLPKLKGTAFGNTIIVGESDGTYSQIKATEAMPVKGAETIAPFTLEEALKAAQLVKDILDSKWISRMPTFKWLDHRNGDAIGRVNTDGGSIYWRRYYKRFYFEGVYADWFRDVYKLHPSNKLAKALIILLDRSIK